VTEPKCTCPTQIVEGHVVRAYLDVNCKVHGRKDVKPICAKCGALVEEKK
jgi:hypothetical protein